MLYCSRGELSSLPLCRVPRVAFRHKMIHCRRGGKPDKVLWDGQSFGDLTAGDGTASVGPPRRCYDVQSMSEEASLNALLSMDQQGTVPSITTYRALLKVCAKRKDLAQARRLHARLVQDGLDSHRFLGEYVVSMLVRCGALHEAVQVIQSLPHRTAFSWTAVISGYTTAEQGQEALRMYECMLREGLHPNTYTLASLLKACGSRADLEAGKRIHADVLKYRCESDLFVGTSLVDMYAKCGSIVDAQNVFDGLPYRDVVLWNTMIGAFAQLGQADHALLLYSEMLEEGVSPNDRTFVRLLHACGVLAESEEAAIVDGLSIKVKALHMGLEVHAHAQRKGYDSDMFVGNTLVSMYGKCGSILDASKVFDGLSDRDVVSWTGVLSAYGQQGQADKVLLKYEQMLEEGLMGDLRALVTAVQACGMLADKEEKASEHGGIKVESAAKGKAMHAAVQKKGYNSTYVIGNTLVSMYGKCGCITDAQDVFDQLSYRDVVSWTVILGAYAQQGQAVEKAILLYEQMLEEGVSPDAHTFVSVVQACGMLGENNDNEAVNGGRIKVKAFATGKAVHADLEKKGFHSDGFIGNALVSMYAKCGSILDAQNVFNGLCHQDVVSWTAMVAAYVHQGQAENAMQLYGQMWDEGVSPNDVTFVSALQACCLLADKEEEEISVVDRRFIKVNSLLMGRRIHADARRTGHDTNVLVGHTLIAMYGKCGSIEEARTVFDRLPKRSVVAWTALIAAHARQGQSERALDLYRQMQDEGVSPNEISLVCILQVCCSAGGLHACAHIHQSLAYNGLGPSLVLSTSLIHSYGRCASMVDAQAVFDALPHGQPDVVAWTALIAGYARQGNYPATVQCYNEMQVSGQKPNGVTFLSLLYACSHSGLVDQGVEYFESMVHHGITPEMVHYTAMIDLLARTGCFTMVEELLSTTPEQPDLSMWVCLLGACRKHGKVVLGKRAFDSAILLEPRHAATYVLMWNIYVDAGLWDQAEEVKELRLKQGACKKPGQSWIQHQGVVCTFSVGDCGMQPEPVHNLLRQIGLQLKAEERDGSSFRC